MPQRNPGDESGHEAVERAEAGAGAPAKKPHGRRKTRQEGRISPFGEVLTEFMGRQRPIWTSGRMARELHTRRQTVGNWIYHDITPPIETMLQILAKLGIPMSEVMEAYRRRGVEIPELAPAPIEPGERSRAVESIPGATPSATRGEEAQRIRQAQQEAENAAARELERQREWDAMIAQTRAVMLATGFPEPALDALLANIAAKRDGEDIMRRLIASEHAPLPPAKQERDQGRDQRREQERASHQRNHQ